MQPHMRVFSLLSLIFLYSDSLLAQATSLVFELQASSAESYAHPHDIVLHADGKRLYVADNGNNRIAILDAYSLHQLDTFAEGEVSEPHDVVFDQAGRLLIADTGNSRIAIYELSGQDGTLVGSINKHLSRPEGVTVSSDGRILATGARSNNLVVYQKDQIIGEVNGLSSPHDVEVDSHGRIWVADAANDRLVQFNHALEIERILSGADYNFNGPRYMDFDAAGRLYVADKYSNKIKVIDKDGGLIQVLGQDQAGKGPGVFNRPEGVEIRGNDVWFSDTYNNRIVRYRINAVAE